MTNVLFHLRTQEVPITAVQLQDGALLVGAQPMARVQATVPQGTKIAFGVIVVTEKSVKERLHVVMIFILISVTLTYAKIRIKFY